MEAAGAAHVGARLLKEIEETTLEELLSSLRTSLATSTANANNNTNTTPAPTRTPSKLPNYPTDLLNGLVHRHFRATQSPSLAVSGRHLPLLYSLIATLLAAPQNKAVVLVDVEGKFDVTRLLECTPLTDPTPTKREQQQPNTTDTHPAAPTPTLPRVQPSDLAHLHIYCPARGSRPHIADVVASAEQYMVYGAHSSKGREWWGTVVIGGGLLPNPPSGSSTASAPANVTAGWKGWLRVDREEVRRFDVGMSVEEALRERERKQKAVDEAGWVASSAWGGFEFGGGKGAQARGR